ncbi:uncharacterized protein LOC143298283 [Babylonia areolata]|uniref:uncharacterized protein LOC143298283 n=1 Tax=Babylonia areolata TaxID=304850 RepID=UPI003FD1C54E
MDTTNGHGPKAESHLPFWTPGSGHYGDTWGKQTTQTMSSCIDLLLPLLETIPVNPNGTFTIADYGTNDGYSSMPLITSVTDYLRKKHGEKLSIQVIYEDQEKNDFNSLFKRLSDDTSYMSKFSNVYPFATNVNFYKQCVPDGTCDVIFTSYATHWMENLDMTYKDCLYHPFASKEECDYVFRQAEKDWVKFLVLRAKELKPGGLLLAQNCCCKSLEDHAENTSRVSKAAELTDGDKYLDMEAAWAQLHSDNIITKEEYDKCSFKGIHRNSQQIKSPFETEDSPARKAGLCLLHFEERVVPSVFKTPLDEKDPKDITYRKSFANKLVASYRVWSQTTFCSSLSPMRTESEKAAILEALYERLHSLVMSKDVESYRCDEFVTIFVARKV